MLPIIVRNKTNLLSYFLEPSEYSGRPMKTNLAILPALSSLAIVSGCVNPEQVETTQTAQASDVLTVSGSLAYRERIALPPGSIATVTIADVSLADAPARTIATRTIALDGRQVPIPFSLDLDSDDLEPRRRYSLRGTIEGPAGALLWSTDTAHLVEPSLGNQDLGTLMMVQTRSASREGTNEAALFYTCGDTRVRFRYHNNTVTVAYDGKSDTLQRVPSASGARFERGTAGSDDYAVFWENGETGLFMVAGRTYPECEMVSPMDRAALQPGRTWQVEDIDGRGIIDRSRVTVQFGSDRRLSGSAGCNTYSGAFDLTGNSLSVSTPLAVTRKMCVPALMAQETRFLETLQQPLTVSTGDDGALLLSGSNGQFLLAR
ncbi:MAG: YbaY family lipoprotein [Alteraurantiacibacter sp.]